MDAARCRLPQAGSEVSEEYWMNFIVRGKSIIERKVGKNGAYGVLTQRIYASGGVFEP